VSARLADYRHFSGVAAGLQWDEAAIEFAPDARSWPALDTDRRRRVATFVAAFLLAEERVAVDLAPFIRAAPDPEMARCFRLQALDEERHSRFFARYVGEVTGPAGSRALVPPALARLFDDRLRAVAAALDRGEAGLAEAVALYHLVLEGVVLASGQAALVAELPDELPGLRCGLERVAADERWHIGFGARVLQDLRPEPGAAEALLRDGTKAAGAWSGVVDPGRIEDAVRLHRRRIAAAGLLQPAVSSTSSAPSTPRATATS
jgi:ribonucleoside-diphosphate reductase beta chain